MDILILDLKKEFWLFNLFSLFVGLILIIIDRSVDFKFADNIRTLTTLYYISILIPSISVIVRILHYVGRRGWNILLIIIPIIGIIWLLAFFYNETVPEKNKWRKNPSLIVYHKSRQGLHQLSP
ncbi:MAG: DUF805 domain-containing protein [Flavobacteriales bacterium]